MDAHWNNLGSLKNTDAWIEVQRFWFIGLERGLDIGHLKSSPGEPNLQLMLRTNGLVAQSSIVSFRDLHFICGKDWNKWANKATSNDNKNQAS